MKREKGSFRIRAKNLFLTYPQLPNNISDLVGQVLNQLSDSIKRTDMKHLIVQELHEDGNPHVHVYLSFETPVGIYSSTKLDLIFPDEQGNSVRYHGKYEAVKDRHGTIQYLLKDQDDMGNVMTNIDLPIYNQKYYTNIYDHLHAVLIQEGLESAVRLMYEQYSYEAMKNGTKILTNLRNFQEYQSRKHIKESERVKRLSDFVEVPNKVYEWIKSEKRKTLILHGPSGTGKTELAKAILNYMDKSFIFVRDINSLKEFSLLTHQAIIFDDLNTESISREVLIHICDTENPSSIRILYGTKNIPTEVDKIFTTNSLRSITRNDNAILRRVEIININKPLHPSIDYKEEPRLIDAGPHNNFGISLSSTPSSLDDNTSPSGDNTVL